MSESLQQRRLLCHWPLVVPPTVWILLLAGLLPSEIVRIVLAAGCIALMLYQWLIYRRTNRGAQLFFLSLVVAGFSLSFVWLGLNVFRFYTYDPESHHIWDWHMLVIRLQEVVVWGMGALGAVVSVWVLFRFAAWVHKRLSAAS